MALCALLYRAGVEEVDVGGGELAPAPHHGHHRHQLTLLTHQELLVILRKEDMKVSLP